MHHLVIMLVLYNIVEPAWLAETVTHGPKISGCNREVAALKRCVMNVWSFAHLELEVIKWLL